MIVTYEDACGIRNAHFRNERFAFVSGSFDLTHPGHARFLERACDFGDKLLVAVGRNAQIRASKGEGRPVYDEERRLYMVNALRFPNFVFLNPETSSTELLAPLREMLEAIRPDAWVVNHDASHPGFREKLAEELGVELVVLDLRRDDPEWERYSTTNLITTLRGLT
jgi:cytidyltransferase-like protein